MTAIRSVVLGCGSYLPQKVLTNAELAARIETSDDWIVQRTGIRQRHIAVDAEMRGELVVGGDMALLDAGALDDPVVGRLNSRRQFGIGQHFLRQIRAAAEHDRTYRSHETASCAVCAFASAPPSRLSIWLILVRRS